MFFVCWGVFVHLSFVMCVVGYYWRLLSLIVCVCFRMLVDVFLLCVCYMWLLCVLFVCSLFVLVCVRVCYCCLVFDRFVFLFLCCLLFVRFRTMSSYVVLVLYVIFVGVSY